MSFSISHDGGNDTTIETNESVFSFTSTIQDLGGVVNNLLFTDSNGTALSSIPGTPETLSVSDLAFMSSDSGNTTVESIRSNSINFGGKKVNKTLDEITKDVMKITHILKNLKIKKIEKKAKKSRKYKNKHKSKKTFKKGKK